MSAPNNGPPTVSKANYRKVSCKQTRQQQIDRFVGKASKKDAHKSRQWSWKKHLHVYLSQSLTATVLTFQLQFENSTRTHLPALVGTRAITAYRIRCINDCDFFQITLHYNAHLHTNSFHFHNVSHCCCYWVHWYRRYGYPSYLLLLLLYSSCYNWSLQLWWHTQMNSKHSLTRSHHCHPPFTSFSWTTNHCVPTHTHKHTPTYHIVLDHYVRNSGFHVDIRPLC